MRAEYLIKRVFYSILVFFITVGITFTVLRQIPRSYLGLDKSVIAQYIVYIYNVLQGDWGYSQGVPVLGLIGEKLYWSLIILVPAISLSLLIGILVGAHFGWKRGSKMDASVLNVMMFTRAIPPYWWAIMFILIFSFHLDLFPLGGYMSISALDRGISYSDILYHSALPIITLTVYSIPGTYYLMRNSMLLTVGEDYILTARAKGLSEKYVLFKHVLKNAMLPMVTMIPLECAYLIAGNIFIEIIFSWPGIGLLTFDAIAAKDFPLLQGIVLIDALLIIIANFSADLFYSHIDPRIKVGGGNV